MGATSCSSDDETQGSTSTDTASGISATASLTTSASASITGEESTKGTRSLDTETSGLSDLIFYYYDNQTNSKLQSYSVPDNLTQYTSSSYSNKISFTTSASILPWQNVYGKGDKETIFFITVNRKEAIDGIAGDVDSKHWSKCVYLPNSTNSAYNFTTDVRGVLKFAETYHRKSLLTVIVEPETGRASLDSSRLEVSINTPQTETYYNDRRACYTDFSSCVSKNIITPSAESKEVNQIKGSILSACFNPAYVTDKDLKTLSIWYDTNKDGKKYKSGSDTELDPDENYTLDLTNMKVTRETYLGFVTGKFLYNGTSTDYSNANIPLTDKQYEEGYTDAFDAKFYYGDQRFNYADDDFAFNPGEQITLNLTLNIAAHNLTLSSVTVTPFTNGESYDIDVKQQ